jgi:hypothetical protein
MATITTDPRLVAELPRGIQLTLAVAVQRTRPLGDVNSAMLKLDMSDEEISTLVDQGFLIAFNISAADSERKCIRILTKSIDLFRETRGRKRLELEWPEIFKTIFGRTTTHLALTGLEVKRGLNCTRGHVENVAREFFTVINEAGPGRGNTPSFTTASVETWLKGRML